MKFLTNNVWAMLLMMLLTGAAQAQPTWQWVTTQSSSSTGDSQFNVPLLDGSGNLVIVGTYRGTITLGNITLTSAGNVDSFVGRMTPAGVWFQAVSIGSTGNDAIARFALDSNGGVAVTGTFTSPTLSIGNALLQKANATSPSTDVFVARLNNAGLWTQAVSIGGNSYEYARGVAVEANGNIVVAGKFDSPTVAFGGITLTNADNTGSNPDIFVARLNTAGNWVQAVRAGGAGYDSPSTLMVDATGNAIVAGEAGGEPGSFGTLPITYSNTLPFNTSGLLVARLSSSGIWTQAIIAVGSYSRTTVYRLLTDGAGNIVLGGRFNSAQLNLGPFVLTNTSTNTTNDDSFVARLNAAGTWTQANAVNGPGNDKLLDMAIDGNGSITAVGTFVGSTISFGNTTLSNIDAGGTTADIFLARMNPTGTWNQAFRTGGQYNESALGVALDGQNGVIVTGVVSNPSSVFGTITTATANLSGFVARLTGFATATAAPTPAARFTLSPNPATGLTHLTWPVAAATQRPVQLLDGLGREVRRLLLPAHATTAPLDVAGLAPGLYVVRCEGAAARLLVK